MKKVEFKISAKDQASKKLKGVRKHLDALPASVKAAAGAFLAWKTVTTVLDNTIMAAARQEEIFKKLESAVNLTGASYKDAKGNIDAFLTSMQNTTRYGDTDMAPSLQQITMLTGSLSKGFEGAAMAADLASSGLFDLNTASRYIAMAMAGEVTMLGRYIPQLKISAGYINDNMTATEKWAVAKGFLNEKFGGMAQKDLETFAGQLAALKNELSDLGELLGDTVLPLLTQTVSAFKDWAKIMKDLDTELEKAASSMTFWNSLVIALGVASGNTDILAAGLLDTIKHIKTELETVDPDISLVNPESLSESLSIITHIKDSQIEINMAGEQEVAILGFVSDRQKAISDEVTKQNIAIKNQNAAYDNMSKDALARIQQQLEAQVITIAGPFAAAFANSIGQANNLEENLKRALKQLIAMVAQATILAAIMSGISGGSFGGLFMRFLGFHKGGMIPKAHSGTFAPDERLILAQTGESVLSRQATQSIGGKRGVDFINMQNRLPDSIGRGRGAGINIIIQGDFIGEESFVKEKLIPIIEGASDMGRTTILTSRTLTDVEY